MLDYNHRPGIAERVNAAIDAALIAEREETPPRTLPGVAEGAEHDARHPPRALGGAPVPGEGAGRVLPRRPSLAGAAGAARGRRRGVAAGAREVVGSPHGMDR